MRKGWVFVCLIMGLITYSIFSGCGQTTTPSPTTTTTLSPSVNAGRSASDAVSAVIGISGVTSTTGNISGVGGVGGFSASSIKTFQPIPDAFFAPLPSDGWMSFTPPDMPTGESLRIRIYTKSGQVINANLLRGKKIAIWEGFDWQSMSEGPPTPEVIRQIVRKWVTDPPPWSSTEAALQAAFYASSVKYRDLSSLWDYIVWAQIAIHPSSEVFFNGINAPRIGTPEATESDKMGSQEVQVTGKDPHGGEVNFTCSVSTDAEGKPVSQTGSGTITRSDGVTIEVSFIMNFDSSGRPFSGTMNLWVPAPDNLHIIMTLYPNGSAEGEVYDTTTSPETKVGIVVIYATLDSSGHKGYLQAVDPATGSPKGDPQYF